MNISASDAKRKKRLIIDVRTPKEYKSKHIPNSFNIPLDDIPKYKDELGKIKKNVAFLCRTGNRATQACNILKENNINSNVIDGGIQSWEDEGYEVIEGPKTWDLERQVRLTAGLLVTLSVSMGLLINELYLGVAAFVGLGLIFAGLTNTCGMAMLLAKAPWNKVSHNSRKVIDRIGD